MAVPVVGVGDVVSADLLNSFNSGKLTSQPLGIIARGKRVTNSTSSAGATLVPIVRLDGVPVFAGRIYELCWPLIRAAGTTTTDRVKFSVLYSTSGVATISSTLLHRNESTGADSTSIVTPFIPTGDATLSVLLAFNRLSGTYTVQCTADDALDYYIKDLGLDPGATGVDL